MKEYSAPFIYLYVSGGYRKNFFEKYPTFSEKPLDKLGAFVYNTRPQTQRAF